MGFGAKDVLQQSCKNLPQKIEVFLDDVPQQLPGLEGVVVLNINSWSAGCSMWNQSASPSRWVWPHSSGGRGQWVWFLPPQDGRPVVGGGGTLLLVARGKDSGVPGGASQNGAGQAGQGESTRDSSRLSRDSILTVPLTGLRFVKAAIFGLWVVKNLQLL